MAAEAVEQLRIHKFEGHEWPVVRLAFGGKYERDLSFQPSAASLIVEKLSRTRIGEPFSLFVTGEVDGKAHNIKRDKESGMISERVLIVKLAIDGIHVDELV